MLYLLSRIIKVVSHLRPFPVPFEADRGVDRLGQPYASGPARPKNGPVCNQPVIFALSHVISYLCLVPICFAHVYIVQ